MSKIATCLLLFSLFYLSIGTYGSDQVALGMHDRRGNEASKQLIDVAAVYVHPQYDSPDRSHDVGMKSAPGKPLCARLTDDLKLSLITQVDKGFK